MSMNNALQEIILSLIYCVHSYLLAVIALSMCLTLSTYLFRLQ